VSELHTDGLLAHFGAQFSETGTDVWVMGEILRWKLKGAIFVFKYVTRGGTLTSATADISVKKALNITTLTAEH